MWCSLIVKRGLGRLAEQVRQVQVDRVLPFILKNETHVAGNLTHFIHGCTFPVGDFFHQFHILLFNDQSHALLRLIADDLLGRQRRVANGQFA